MNSRDIHICYSFVELLLGHRLSLAVVNMSSARPETKLFQAEELNWQRENFSNLGNVVIARLNYTSLVF